MLLNTPGGQGGQNIAGAGGGGAAAAIFGGIANLASAKNKFAIEKSLMDYSHQQKLDEITHREKAKALGTGLTIAAGHAASMAAYQNALGDAAGKELYGEHLAESPLNEKGVFSKSAAIRAAKFRAEKKANSGAETTPAAKTSPAATTSPEDVYSEGTPMGENPGLEVNPSRTNNLSVGMGEGK